MQQARRNFLIGSATSAAALAAAQVTRGAESGAPATGRQVFELRTYRFASAQKQQAFEQFAAEALVPALNRAGVQPVGVFKATAKDNPKLSPEPTDLYVLLPHNSIDSVIAVQGKLAADAEFQKAGQASLAAPKSDPAFARYDSTLLLAMEGAPRIEVPSKEPGRVFELRTYESHNEERAANKLSMFNAGEFAVFVRAGMPGVFFGGAIAGVGLPQLTYMVVHPSAENIKKNWGAFGGDPEWKKLSSGAGYKDNVSKIISTFLRPTAGSQV